METVSFVRPAGALSSGFHYTSSPPHTHTLRSRRLARRALPQPRKRADRGDAGDDDDDDGKPAELVAKKPRVRGPDWSAKEKQAVLRAKALYDKVPLAKGLHQTNVAFVQDISGMDLYDMYVHYHVTLPAVSMVKHIYTFVVERWEGEPWIRTQEQVAQFLVNSNKRYARVRSQEVDATGRLPVLRLSHLSSSRPSDYSLLADFREPEQGGADGRWRPRCAQLARGLAPSAQRVQERQRWLDDGA